MNNNTTLNNNKKSGNKNMARNTNFGHQVNNNGNDQQDNSFIKREQIYRMLDKFYHTLNSGVSHESFASAAVLYNELSNHLEKSEYVSLGEAWRNLYVDENEQGFAKLKEAVSKVKVRFA